MPFLKTEMKNIYIFKPFYEQTNKKVLQIFEGTVF